MIEPSYLLTEAQLKPIIRIFEAQLKSAQYCLHEVEDKYVRNGRVTESRANDYKEQKQVLVDCQNSINLLQSLPMVQGEPVAHVMGVFADSDEISVPLPPGTRLYASPQALTPITADDVTDEMVLAVMSKRLHNEKEIIAAAYNAVIKHRSEAK